MNSESIPCPGCGFNELKKSEEILTLRFGIDEVYLKGIVLICPNCNRFVIPPGKYEVVSDPPGLDKKEHKKVEKIKPKHDKAAKTKKAIDDYLSSHIPNHKEIRNNILYDTETADKIYIETRNGGYGKNTYPFKRYYYRTPSNRFFFIDVIYGKDDDFNIMDEKALEFALKNNPALYKEFCREYEE